MHIKGFLPLTRCVNEDLEMRPMHFYLGFLLYATILIFQTLSVPYLPVYAEFERLMRGLYKYEIKKGEIKGKKCCSKTTPETSTPVN